MKYAETAFLNIFKSLSDAPDPEPFLSSLLEERKASELAKGTEEELANTKQKLDNLGNENSKLKEQVRQLDQLQKQVDEYKGKLSSMVKEQVVLKEQELREENDELIRHLKEREKDLQHQLNLSNRQLTQLQVTHDSNEAERIEQSLKEDREILVKLAEHDILQSDLDHANARIVDLQTTNSKLRNELAQFTQGDNDSGGIEDYRNRVRELEDETEKLFSQLEKSDNELRLKESKFNSGISALERESSAKDEELKRLRLELDRKKDYDEVKRDLDIMKSVEFSVSDWGMGDDDNGSEGNSESLEKLLVKRNKALENRLTDARNQLDAFKTELAKTSENCKALESGLAEKIKLAERLEADLLSVQPTPTAAEKNSIDGAAESVEMKPLPGRNSSTANGNATGSDGLLAIVTGQRDRFRQRNIELEDELRVQGSSVNELRRQVEQVKQDNLRLYEEIKYLRSYTASSSSTSNGRTILGTDTSVISMPSKFSSINSSSKMIDMDTSVGAKYKGMYEESLNPFNVFHRRETSRRVRSMGLIDRLIYMFSNFVMGHRKARLALLAYVALLHLLVLITLYRSVLLADSEPQHEPVQL
ncbi:hypothetical protein GGI12_002577 [Dipsacomyces acuminosporus]|nr:hypothetical protein GGI12_002577 [Dipsacomyces acuminosporus]